jgi:hypothetical protein
MGMFILVDQHGQAFYIEALLDEEAIRKIRGRQGRLFDILHEVKLPKENHMSKPPILKLGEQVRLEKDGELWEVIRVSTSSADIRTVNSEEVTLTDKEGKTRVVRFHRTQRGISAHSSVYREAPLAE